MPYIYLLVMYMYIKISRKVCRCLALITIHYFQKMIYANESFIYVALKLYFECSLQDCMGYLGAPLFLNLLNAHAHSEF